MMTPFPPKTPAQMRREAEDGPQRSSPPLSPEQKRETEARHPRLGGDNDRDDELDATAEWLAHLHAGRISCPEPVDGEVGKVAKMAPHRMTFVNLRRRALTAARVFTANIRNIGNIRARL